MPLLISPINHAACTFENVRTDMAAQLQAARGLPFFPSTCKKSVPMDLTIMQPFSPRVKSRTGTCAEWAIKTEIFA